MLLMGGEVYLGFTGSNAPSQCAWLLRILRDLNFSSLSALMEGQ
jgi:hypothetical protein